MSIDLAQHVTSSVVLYVCVGNFRTTLYVDVFQFTLIIIIIITIKIIIIIIIVSSSKVISKPYGP